MTTRSAKCRGFCEAEEKSKAISFIVEVSPELFQEMCSDSHAANILYDEMDDCFTALERAFGDGRDVHLRRGVFRITEGAL